MAGNSGVGQTISEHREKRKIILSTVDEKLRKIKVTVDEYARETDKALQYLDMLMKFKTLQFRIEFRSTKSGSTTHSRGPYLIAVVKEGSKKIRKYLGSFVEVDLSSEAMAARKDTKYVTSNELKNLMEIQRTICKLDNIQARLGLLVKFMGIKPTGVKRENRIAFMSRNIGAMIDALQVNTEEHYSTLKISESAIDYNFRIFNRVLKKRYMSLVAVWVYRQRSNTMTISPTGAEYRVISSLGGQTRGGGGRRYSESIDRFVSKKFGVKTRTKGKITWELINQCQLIRYRKFILANQKSTMPYIYGWQDARDKLQTYVRVINKIFGETE